MPTPRLLLCLSLAWCTGIVAQTESTVPAGFSLSFGVGAGVPERVYLLEEPLVGPAYVAAARVDYRWALPLRTALRAGLAARYVHRDAESAGRAWRSHATRFEIPVLLDWSPIPRWSTSLGASARNDRDLVDLDIRHDQNLRWDALARVGYRPAAAWTFFALVSRGLDPLPRASYAVDPRTQILLGAELQLSRS